MINNIDLDNPDVFRRVDSENMLKCLHETPSLCQQAWQMAADFDLPQDYATANKVVVLGMGGSAIGGDLVKSLAAEARIPILIQRDYGLPSFIDERALVIASSYSGNTEETLASFEQAVETPAKKLVITTGGKLKMLAEAKNVPAFCFNYDAQPRAALPFSFLSLLCFLNKLGFLDDRSVDVIETASLLAHLSQEIDEAVPLSRNPAKQLAQRLFGRLSVIYGAGILSEVGHRWKTQINENSKAWAFYETFPELNHNAVVGYEFPAQLTSKVVVVLLQSSLLPQRIRLRYEATRLLLDQSRVSYQIVDARGMSPLSHVLSLVLFGDYVSYYLAVLYKVDPTPVKNIDYLKGWLVQHG